MRNVIAFVIAVPVTVELFGALYAVFDARRRFAIRCARTSRDPARRMGSIVVVDRCRWLAASRRGVRVGDRLPRDRLLRGQMADPTAGHSNSCRRRR